MENLLDPIFLIRTLGPIGVFAVVLIESGFFFGFFFPGDSLLFTAGLLSASGFFPFPLLIIGCVVATVLGGMFGYFFGKQVGPSIFSKEDSFFFHKKHIAEAHDFFEKHGVKTIILARFLPILRTFAPIFAGVANMKYSIFFFFNLVGAVLWSFLLVGGGYYLGRLIPNIEKYILPIIVFIIFVSFSPTLVKIYKSRGKARQKDEPR